MIVVLISKRSCEHVGGAAGQNNGTKRRLKHNLHLLLLPPCKFTAVCSVLNESSYRRRGKWREKRGVSVGQRGILVSTEEQRREGERVRRGVHAF